MYDKTPAVVVLSGGQDSATCLALALRLHKEVHTISFDYGQQHRIELDLAHALANRLGAASHRVVKVDALKDLFTSALMQTADDKTVNDPHPEKAGLPASFVPQRNAIFMTLAHGLAQKLGAKEVYTGVCQTDYSGYPDCRSVFIQNLNKALNIGYEADIHFNTPLMQATKAETWAIAAELGVMDIIRDSTNTCYNGNRERYWDWGFGCGECPACELRAKGYNEFMSGRNMISNTDLHAFMAGVRDAQANGEALTQDEARAVMAKAHEAGIKPLTEEQLQYLEDNDTAPLPRPTRLDGTELTDEEIMLNAKGKDDALVQRVGAVPEMIGDPLYGSARAIAIKAAEEYGQEHGYTTPTVDFEPHDWVVRAVMLGMVIQELQSGNARIDAEGGEH